MHRFASEFIGKKVILRQESMVAGVVGELVVNPENGEFLGLVVVVPAKKKVRKAVPEKEILGMSRDFILLRGVGSLGDIDEIVRIKNVREMKITIRGNKVYTVSNVYLGRVTDYTIDLVSGKLSRLYVQARGLKGIAGGKAIDAKRIVSIKKQRITVDDAVVKVGKRVAVKGAPVKTECN